MRTVGIVLIVVGILFGILTIAGAEFGRWGDADLLTIGLILIGSGTLFAIGG
jgi:hypothetical protein